MAEIKNLEALNRKLQERAAKALKDSGSVIVGYTAAYALYVHENLEMTLAGKPRSSGLGVYWGPSGAGPKFLEQPARELARDLAEIIKGLMQKGKTMMQSLLVAGLRLQRESQKRVPVEYGNLKNSAFTREEK